ncbi:alpha/beta fold hydrolase [Amycolatopsis sp. NPDC006125]|uniref:alpha/beta fold hydrolase n=1 Tax=Amycolatopsis sp. NPDC006125 TaxID=3156730 RepID=UPI0033B0A804
MRRFVTLALTAALAVSAVPAQADPLRAVETQPVVWAPCADLPLECATIAVPLDYAHPGGRRISIAISRHRATDPAHRRGVLLTNPGGPGLSGLAFPLSYADQDLARVYDIIGMDPRGVGESTPLRCLQPPFPALDRPTRPTDADIVKMADFARRTEQGCRQISGPLRPYMNTPNTARDMDVVRAALGEAKLNYLGVSYGTTLGAVYGTLFPAHLDRSVLDSALHPTAPWHDQGYAAAAARRSNLDDWAAWTASRDSEFRLGSTPREVEENVEALAAVLETRSAGAYHTVADLDSSAETGSEFVPVDATRYPGQWAELARSIRAALDSPGPVRAPSPAAGSVEVVDNAHDPVICDWRWPADLAVYERDLRYYREAMPYGATASVAGELAPGPCAYRSFPRTQSLPKPVRAGYPAGLVVQGQRDTTTPYVNGVAMAAALQEPLVTVADGVHGQFGLNPCVNAIVNHYLVDGVLPAPGASCPAAGATTR